MKTLIAIMLTAALLVPASAREPVPGHDFCHIDGPIWSETPGGPPVTDGYFEVIPPRVFHINKIVTYNKERWVLVSNWGDEGGGWVKLKTLKYCSTWHPKIETGE